MNKIYRGVAPRHLIKRDFQYLDSKERLRTTWEVERLVLAQSVQGHAHEGHSLFRGMKYPNTTMDHIYSALDINPTEARASRQRLIDEIKDYVKRVIDGDEDTHLTNQRGEGFLGSSMFRKLEVSNRDVLGGLYLGGLRDNVRIRFDMELKYGVNIGGGKCYLVDTKVMDELDLDGELLAHGSHESMIDFYRKRGLIVGDEGRDGENIEYMYIRHRSGAGASDDAAIVAAGLLYGVGVATGVFLADTIDTLEKYVPVYSDQDYNLAMDIQANYNSLEFGEKEAQHLAYLSVAEDDSKKIPDSSLRYLLLVDRRLDLTAIESHLMFVQDGIRSDIPIGLERVNAREFYQYISERVKNSPDIL